MSHLIDKSVFQPSIKQLVKNFTWRCIYLRLSSYQVFTVGLLVIKNTREKLNYICMFEYVMKATLYLCYWVQRNKHFSFKKKIWK